MSILFSEDEIIAKVYFKDGSEKIGYIDEDYSESQIKLISIDGGWVLYSKNSINDIAYSGFDVKSSSKKDPNSATMISLGSADISEAEGSALSFKYAFYTKKSNNIYNGFSLSGWNKDWSSGHTIKYLIAFSHLKFLNESHKGFYYNIDGGISFIVNVSNFSSLFGISPSGILSITQEAWYGSSGIKATRTAFGIGTNISIGYSFKKIMISYSLAHYILPDPNRNDFDINKGHRSTRYSPSLNLSYLF